jgi:hypothetical protein
MSEMTILCSENTVCKGGWDASCCVIITGKEVNHQSQLYVCVLYCYTWIIATCFGLYGPSSGNILQILEYQFSSNNHTHRLADHYKRHQHPQNKLRDPCKTKSHYETRQIHNRTTYQPAQPTECRPKITCTTPNRKATRQPITSKIQH